MYKNTTFTVQTPLYKAEIGWDHTSPRAFGTLKDSNSQDLNNYQKPCRSVQLTLYKEEVFICRWETNEMNDRRWNGTCLVIQFNRGVWKPFLLSVPLRSLPSSQVGSDWSIYIQYVVLNPLQNLCWWALLKPLPKSLTPKSLLGRALYSGW